MPRDFGQIQSAFWRHPDIRKVSHRATLVMAYLLSSPHANGTGCYCLPNDYACGDLRMSDVELAETFEELAAVGLVLRCARTEYVLIRGFLKWNPVHGPKVAGARMKEISAIPSECSLRHELAEQIQRFGGEHLTVPDTLSKGFGKGIETLPHARTGAQTRSVPFRPEGRGKEPEQTLPHARAREEKSASAEAHADSPRSLPNGNGVDQPAPPSKGVPDHIRAEWEAKGLIKPKPPPAPPPAEQAVLLAELEGRYPTPPGDPDGPPAPATDC